MKTNLGYCREGKEDKEDEKYKNIKNLEDSIKNEEDILGKKPIIKCTRARTFFMKNKCKYNNERINNEIKEIQNRCNEYKKNKCKNNELKFINYKNKATSLELEIMGNENIISGIIVLTSSNIPKDQLDDYKKRNNNIIVLFDNWYDHLELCSDSQMLKRLKSIIKEIKKQ